MTKLSDTQLVILGAAAQREDRNVLPLPGSLRGGAAAKVVGALLSRGLIAETPTDSRTKADAALNRIWRNDADGRAILLYITDAGLAAIGIEPESGDSAPTGADAAPSAEPPQDAPVEADLAPKARTPRGHETGQADRDAPRRGRRHHRRNSGGLGLESSHRERRPGWRAEKEARADDHLREGRTSRTRLSH